jgi:acyl-CoA thioesterase
VSEVSSLLALEPAGEGRFRVRNEGDASVADVVFGGQLLGQMIVTASRAHEGKQVRTIHTLFARAARVSGETELALEPIHAGRSFASTNGATGKIERPSLAPRLRVSLRSSPRLLSGDERWSHRRAVD